MKRKSADFSQLSGLRALAAVAIVGYHALATNFTGFNGWTEMGSALRGALPIFFFLSAFLLYRPFVAARLGNAPRPNLAGFWLKRIVRIVPAYWIALTLAAMFLGLPEVFGRDGWQYYTFVYVYSQHTVGGGLEPAWTLCVDMSFYLVLPLFAAIMDRVWARRGLGRAVGTELGVLGMVWLISTLYWFVFVSGASVTVAELQMREWNLLANLNWFVLGMGLAVLSVSDCYRINPLTRLLSRRHGVSVCWLAAALTFVFIARSYYFTSETTRHLLFSLACLLVFAPAVLVQSPTRIHRVLSHPWLVWLGVTSYGIYLYHGPVLNLLSASGVKLGQYGPLAYLSLFAGGLTIATLVSFASHSLMERPLQRLAREVESAAADGLLERRARHAPVLATTQVAKRSG